MPTPTDISMEIEEVLRVKLEQYRIEHRDLDDAILALVPVDTVDQLALTRLKKKKLVLKDLICRIGNQLTPDIIA